jgi:hypothetical protein
MNDATLQALIAQLWPQGDSLTGDQVYMVLDGARDPFIAWLVRSGTLEYACLYTGVLSARLQAAAPYIIHLAPQAALTASLLRRGWGNSWGFLTVVLAHVGLNQQRLHFKKLLRVRDEAGTELHFRYYDPRVMRTYLPTCTQDELRQFFGPVPRIVVESAGGAEMVSHYADGSSHSVALADVGTSVPS